jgi:hypothetical protein
MSPHLQVISSASETAKQEDFFSLYFSYTADTEVPAFFNRWTSIVGIGAFLGRGLYFSHGHFTVNPNVYCMLIGSPGTRKSSAIKLMKSILVKAGYNTIAADRTTKEKFLLDLGQYKDEPFQPNQGRRVVAPSFDTWDLMGDSNDITVDKEMLIAADEFNDFIGLGNHDFISLLGNLWDYSGNYENRIKNGKSVNIYNPTISILGGNTPTGFSLAFPTEILGQGFFSRLLLIYGEPNGRKITFPKAPCPAATLQLVEYLQRIKRECVGEVTMTPGASKLVDKIYREWKGIDDVRFESYSNRRFTHLLKLCLVVTAVRFSTQITEHDVVYANTILSHAEHLMPKALGEFGKARHSDTVHKVMQVLDSATSVLTISDVWKHVVQDLEHITDLGDILRNLVMAEKIQGVAGGFLPNKKVLVEVSTDTVDYGLLTKEELGAQT